MGAVITKEDIVLSEESARSFLTDLFTCNSEQHQQINYIREEKEDTIVYHFFE